MARDGAADSSAESERLLRARVDIIASFLPMKMWLNPSWAVIAIVPFVGLFPELGDVQSWRLAATILLHLANTLIAGVFYVRYRRDPSDAEGWLRLFLVFQFLIGLSWGAMPWLMWVPDSPLNHLMIVVPLVAVLWSNSAARTTFWSLYLAGVAPVVALTEARLLSSGSPVDGAIGAVFAIAFLYTAIVAANAKKQTDAGIRTAFANQDLTAELRGARDDALRKRFEAETANASKTTFLANMSHELRTPLNAILGFSDIIANETFGAVGVTRYRDYARDINMSGAHLLSIINDILDIAKIESGKMSVDAEPLDARTTIDNSLRVLAPRVREKGQHLSVRVAEDARIVYADLRAFKQILINLVTNAVKFTQMGGAITVHGRRAETGGFELVVEDNGPGIEASLLDRVFQPFNQIDNRYSRQEGGTGLGLSLVRGLANLHGGRAWIETEFGSGVKVHVYFPEAPASKSRQPPDLRLTG